MGSSIPNLVEGVGGCEVATEAEAEEEERRIEKLFNVNKAATGLCAAGM
jgi:hypothetical protein